MSHYPEIEGILRDKTNAKILILDANNIQFYFQNKELIPSSHIFSPYDLVLIPGWVHEEYSHHDDKVQYLASIDTEMIIVDEVNDYLPMLDYVDEYLMQLFRKISIGSPSQKYFNLLSKKPTDEWSESWIEDFYEDGFHTNQIGSKVTKKNAGEVSILTLCFCLLYHYPNRIESISIASSDFGLNDLKRKAIADVNKSSLNNKISKTPPISFLSTDVSIYNAILAGVIQPEQIPSLRPNPKSTIYIEKFADGTTASNEISVDTPTFMNMCTNPNKYGIIF